MNLNKKFIENAPDGLYSDSSCPGLYLRVRREGKSRSWIFKRQVANLRKEVALGSAFKLPVAKARTMADRLRSVSDSEFLKEPLHKRWVICYN
ncbi:Arm DNA-binding domain-containing protein [Parasutterella excrementihominis]|uniref:Arm DNA-binding domain-containing protein n=1 Tax=Parasutterella excrementihominis TaxID=487175 RepID=UPI0035634BCD